MKLLTPIASLLLALLPALHAADAPLLDLFPASEAPTFLAKQSEFVVSKQFAPGQHFPSHWVEGVEERPVFHAYLMHQSTDERSWEMRIGRGGQIYSIVSSFGEAMPPQRLMSPFNDETWQMALEARPPLARRRHQRIHPHHRSRAAMPQAALRESLPRRPRKTRQAPEPSSILHAPDAHEVLATPRLCHAADKADTKIEHRKLSDLPDLAPRFQAGECTKATDLLVR